MINDSLIGKFQDGGLLPEGGVEEDIDTQKGLLEEIDKLRQELIQEQQKKSSFNDDDLQMKEKLYQESKSRAGKLDQEVEAQKVIYYKLQCVFKC